MTNKEKEQRREAKAIRKNRIIYKQKKNKRKKYDFLGKLKEYAQDGK